MKKRLLASLLCGVMTVSLLPMTASAEEQLVVEDVSVQVDTQEAEKSGTCGENVTWTLDDEGTLTISGTGEMYDYGDSCDTPWDAFSEEIKNIVLQEGITNVGECAFGSCILLETVSLPDSLLTIGEYGFYGCPLTEIKLPGNVTSIGKLAFANCKELQTITIPASVKTIGEDVFQNCKSLKNVYYEGRYGQWKQINIDEENDNLNKAKIHFADDSKDGKSGMCGDNLKWNLNSNGILTISGTGDMDDYGGRWKSQSKKIKKVVVKDGVTSIGECAFMESYSNLKRVVLADSLKRIEYGAFYLCANLETITFGRGLEYIGESAFWNTWKVKNIYYAGSKAQWKKVKIKSGNKSLKSAKMHYNSGTANNISEIENLAVKNIKGNKLKVTWSKNAKATGYQLQYSLKSSFPQNGRTNKWITSNKTTSTTLSKLKKNKKYYVRMRCYVTQNGKKTYSKWTTSGRVTVKK